MTDWSPSTYRKFEDERTRPARDLLAQVAVAKPRIVVDMGCGPGNSTELLVERFPDAEVVGLDTSPNMLEEARLRVPGARFDFADANHWVPGSGTDVVFANAIYQWVPDNLAVLTRVLGALEPGATMAVQMPDNINEPSHAAMRELAADGPWAEKLRDAARPALPSVRQYYEALAPLASRVDIWHTTYNHVLAHADAVVEWVRATGLRPFLDPLDAAEKAVYLARYRAKIAEAYPALASGQVLLRFPRLFIVARR